MDIYGLSNELEGYVNYVPDTFSCYIYPLDLFNNQVKLKRKLIKQREKESEQIDNDIMFGIDLYSKNLIRYIRIEHTFSIKNCVNYFEDNSRYQLTNRHVLNLRLKLDYRLKGVDEDD